MRKNRNIDENNSITFDIAKDVQAIRNNTFDSQDNPADPAGNRDNIPVHPAAHEEARRAGQDVREPEPPVITVKKKSRTYAFISYMFVLIFIVLIGYLVYFNIELRGDILRSPYNNRQDALAKYVSRGSILSSDGVVLAETRKTESGEEYRYYPYGREYAHVVGFSVKGRSGIESIANTDLLTSHAGVADQIKNELLELKNPGDNVISTLSHTLQEASYEALGDRKGAVVIIEPSTGAIRAMVSKPDFDPNTIEDEWADIISDDTSSVLLNRATQGRYAPGSTFKMVTSLAWYREKGSVDGLDFNCTGEFTYEDHTVHCYENTAHGKEDLTTAFANSCNCAFSEMSLELGSKALIDTSRSLLFNSKLPSAGLEYNKSQFPLERSAEAGVVMQTGFGQGKTLVSPYHMLLITSAVANEGKVMRPYLTEKVESYNGEVVSSKTAGVYKSIMTPEEADMLKGLMEQVVLRGTAGALNNSVYSMAGKTGSAEFVRSDGTIGTHSWFVGFTDVNDPDLAIAIIAEDSGSGSSVAVPMAKEIFDRYYGA